MSAGHANEIIVIPQAGEEAVLSPRQAEIARMIVSGKSTREIALALRLSPRTVETHIAGIYNKHGVSSRAELIIALLGPGAHFGTGPVADAVKTNIPAQRAPLLGRATDIAITRRLMRESRMVTLTGAGGIGKTRVALAVGESALADFKAGAYFVDLAPLARGSSVADAIARALSIDPVSRATPIELLRSNLGQKSLVLIVDNCEHLIMEAAEALDALLGACPQLHVLATSREPLRIAGERTYHLPSLRVPSAADSLALDAARGATYAAVELFTQRAQAADFTFALTDDNVRCVAEICRRVDGIPLAVELAAARVKILPVTALAAELESHLRILGRGDRSAMPRHQTMHALIDWSYDLLEPSEQLLFERLSVFSGGCALPEAIAVYGDESVDEVAMLDMLASLVDKSLVVADATGPQPRYGMLQTFTQYASEKLSARGDAALTSRRHAVAYLRLAERFEREFHAGPTTSWYQRTEREVGNWRAALDWTLGTEHDELLGQQLVAAMNHVWLKSDAAQRWLKRARERVDEKTPQTVVAALDYSTAYMNFEYGDFEQTVASCSKLSRVYDELGDPVRSACLRSWEGAALALLGRAEEAEPLLASALGVAREHAQRALAAFVLRIMAQLSFTRGDAADGRTKYAEAIAIYESVGAERSAAVACSNLAEGEFASGNTDEAARLGMSSLIAMRQVGTKPDIALQLVNQAGYCIAAGRWGEAKAHAREAVQVGREFQQHVFFLLALHCVAVLAALSPDDAQDGPARAARLLGYSDAMLIRRGYAHETNRQLEYDRALVALRGTFAEAQLAQQLGDGALMTAEQAIELALSIEAPPYVDAADDWVGTQ